MKNILNKIILGLTIILVGVGGFFLGEMRGAERGRREAYDEGREAVKEVVGIVGEKDALQRKLSLALTEPEFSTSALEEYKAEIEKIYSETEDESSRRWIETYLEKVEETLEAYRSGDAVAIRAEFLELRESARKAAEGLGEIFLRRIENAVGRTGFYF